MDPLSMTASVIAVLQLITTFTSYFNDVRIATAEQAKVAVEASSLYGLLTTLRFRVTDARPDDPWFAQIKILGSKGGPLDQLKNILETMVASLPIARTRDRIKLKLLWTFAKKDVDDALQRMERLKSLITCALANDLLTLAQTIRDDVMILAERTEQLQISTKRLQTHADYELANKLSRWLALPDSSVNYHAALEKRDRQTGLWLLNGQPFVRWKTSTSSFLWLHGRAGCGKTVLSATLLENILQHAESQPNTAVSYFYFDFKEVEKRSSGKAARSILFQFARQDDGLKALERLYQECDYGQKQPAEDKIRLLLREYMTRIQNKYIILDALDECASRDGFLTFLYDLICLKQPGLRILVTSCREKDIEDQLAAIADHNVNIQSSVVNEDILVYVRNKLATDSRFKKWSPADKEEIIKVMKEKAGGVFQWADCQLESIRNCVRSSALGATLSSLPLTLNETYDRILQGRKSAGHLQDAITALQWLCYSERPLKSTEVVEALAIKNGEDGDFFPEERLMDPADIMMICSSLINCNDINGVSGGVIDASDWSDRDDDYSTSDDAPNGGTDRGHTTEIQLAHSSVHEYLLSDQCAFKSDFRPQTCHAAMAESCLRYLLRLAKQAPLTPEVVDRHPLAAYAAQYWWQHAQKLDKLQLYPVFQLARRLLADKSVELFSWVQLCRRDRLWNASSHKTIWTETLPTEDDLAPSLYYAASIGLSEVVQDMIQSKIDVNVPGGMYGFALQAASAYGYDKVVQILITAGANVNAQGGEWNTALQAASIYGHEKTVRMLLGAGADVNAQGGAWNTALQAATAYGREQIVRILITEGADVKGVEGKDALSTASGHGDGKIVRMLLDAGANVKGADGRPALAAASNWGDEQIVKMLLDAGADVKGADGGLALQAASRRGHDEIVRMLLHAGADAKGKHGSSALQEATHSYRDTIIQMLLKAGATYGREQDIYARLFLLTNDDKTVEQLLRDAKVNMKGEDGYDMLWDALDDGGEKEAETLRELDLLTAGMCRHLNTEEDDIK